MMWTSVQVCRELGITYRQLDYWCRDGGVVRAEPGSGSQRQFSDDEVARLRFVADMVKAGIRMSEARDALDSPIHMARLITDLERVTSLARRWLRGQESAPGGPGSTQIQARVS
jgi:DNA-binding transcriptional MerR regulator